MTTFSSHSTRKAVQARGLSIKNRVTSEADAHTMKAGSSSRQNHIRPKLMLPSRLPACGRNQTRLKRRVTCMLPRAQRIRWRHSAPMVPGSSDHTTACGSKMARRPASWVWNVVTVSSASVVVSTRPPRSSRFSRECSCAPPARQAIAPSTS